MDYRSVARKALARAIQELNSDDDHRLPYAALELRMSLEALVYERATRYSEELSNRKLSTWQPKKLLSLLMEIDPYADKTSSISCGREEEYGKPASVMQSLGTDRLLSLGEIKKYYDRLGSYLHTPTLNQVSEGKGAPPERIRSRCMEVSKIIEEVLSSPVFNVDMKVTATLECEKCGNKIVRRIPPEANTVIARCIECSASYEIARASNNKADWKPLVKDVECANSSCKRTMQLWECELTEGTSWICSTCKGRNQVMLGISYNPPEQL